MYHIYLHKTWQLESYGYEFNEMTGKSQTTERRLMGIFKYCFLIKS